MFKKENIPNLLCYIRIAAAPGVVLFMCLAAISQCKTVFILISGSIFGLAMITDAFDGYYARKYGIVSDKGKILDPLADKIIIFGTMLSFLFYEFISGCYGFYLIPLLIVILAREIIVSELRNYTARKGAVIGAIIWGKVKTCVQTVCIGFSFFFYLFNLNDFVFYSICIASLVTLISLFPYIFLYSKKLKELKASKEVS